MIGVILLTIVAACFVITAFRPLHRPAARAGEPARAVVCPHRNAVDVDSVVTGEILARWCPDCDTQLEPLLRFPVRPQHHGPPPVTRISAVRENRQAGLNRRNELMKELEVIGKNAHALGKYGHQPLLITRNRRIQIWKELKEITEKLEKAGETDGNLR